MTIIAAECHFARRLQKIAKTGAFFNSASSLLWFAELCSDRHIWLRHIFESALQRSQPPSQKGNGRTIAAIFAHLHNSRLKWLKNSAPHLKCPPPLDPHRCTMKQAAAAHRRCASQCLRMLSEALSAAPNRRVSKFSRDSWMPTWPAGGTMFAYMFSHEAHHRGQILMLAHQLGYRVLDKTPGIWQWEKLWKQAGLTTRPRSVEPALLALPSTGISPALFLLGSAAHSGAALL